MSQKIGGSIIRELLVLKKVHLNQPNLQGDQTCIVNGINIFDWNVSWEMKTIVFHIFNLYLNNKHSKY